MVIDGACHRERTQPLGTIKFNTILIYLHLVWIGRRGWINRVLNQIRYTYQKRCVFYFNRMVPIDLGDRYESRRITSVWEGDLCHPLCQDLHCVSPTISFTNRSRRPPTYLIDNILGTFHGSQSVSHGMPERMDAAFSGNVMLKPFVDRRTG